MIKDAKHDSLTQDQYAHAHARTRAHARTHAQVRKGSANLSQRVRSGDNTTESNENPADTGPKTESGRVSGESAEYEVEIQRRIVNALTSAGYFAEPLTQGRGYPPRRKRLVQFGKTPGAPDIDVIGENLHLEVKRPGEYLDPHQRAYHARAHRFGAVVRVVRSPEEALAAVEGLRELRALLRWMDRWLT